MPEAGLEPARPFRKQGILSPWCLPIPPLRQTMQDKELQRFAQEPKPDIVNLAKLNLPTILLVLTYKIRNEISGWRIQSMNHKIAMYAIILVIATVFVTDAEAQRRRGRGDSMMKQRKDNAPKVRDTAPTFTLKSHDGKSETSLASFKGEKPVVLFFGSYT